MAFRNVKSILSSVGVLLDHDPQTVDVRDARLDAVNRRYLDVAQLLDWLGDETEVNWYVWEDRTNTSTGFTATVTTGSAIVDFNGSLGDPAVSGTFTHENAGQIFIDENGVEYLINRFTTQLLSTNTRIYLNKPYTGTTATLTTWTIQCHHTYLPVDCARALGFIDRNTEPGTSGMGRLVVLDRRKEELWFSNQSDTTGTIYWIVDDDAMYDQPPDPGWTAVDDTTGGTLPPSSMWEICYTFTYQGRETPPSTPVRVQLSAAASHRIQIANMMRTEVSGVDCAVYKNVYVRQLMSSTTTFVYGRWLLLAADLASATTTQTFSATSQLSTAESSILRYQNGRKWMRPKWIPGQDQTLRLRYLRLPKRLVADSDVPQWPEAYHDLLVYAATIDLGIQHSLPATKMKEVRDEYSRLLEAMRSTQLHVPDSRTSKEMGLANGRGVWPWRTNGTVTSNYSG